MPLSGANVTKATEDADPENAPGLVLILLEGHDATGSITCVIGEILTREYRGIWVCVDEETCRTNAVDLGYLLPDVSPPV